MKKLTFALVACALTACSPPVPDSGVGFGSYEDYNTYRAQRDVELAGARPGTTTSAVVEASPDNPPVQMVGVQPLPDADPADRVTLNNPGISDENDFAAVANRQSIQSDAERLQAQRDAYQVIQPTAVPVRSGSDGPNIVQFALSTRNRPGEKIYRRSAIFAQTRYDRNCGKYASPDLAQEAFLNNGGPQRDKLGVDPDGDGFACSWDPTPFRQINPANG